MDAVKLDPEDEYLRGSLYLATVGSGHTYVYLSRHTALHRYLVGVPNTVVDHINGNTLDNRKVNLRSVPQRVNIHNSDVVWGRSKFKGVFPRGNKWRAYIKHSGKTLCLGTHASEEAAHRARLTKEKELWGISPRREKMFVEIAA